jgi:undecaprenyl diphosphate synthase
MDPSSDLRGFFPDPSAASLVERLDTARIPQHVAIIMDGNGRWAQTRRLPRVAGHRAGAKAVREAILTADALGVRYLTIYSFSSENWSRPLEEVAGLMRLFVETLESELEALHREGVRLRLIGRAEGVPEKTLAAFRRAEERTAGNAGLTLLVALNYGGRTEIADAVAQIAHEVAEGTLAASDIDEEAIASRLYTSDIPDPDLVVRTSGEMRLSNFLLWQVAYSELWVTPTLWPDFTRNDFLQAVVDFQERDRRFGG